ncbi:hypothetical protein K4K54_007228 [Colletotrichum sp. SAR 10_86]|nr:hypothetical protein KHU50_011949 [Colletotrichum sp. SAR 10_65]KAI8234961.1 hypothetical protein K4K54_007228 [Colletotrichum sp. SAR 10_86]
MANIFRQATSWLYTGLAVSILGSWSLMILVCVAMTALGQDPGLLQLIALPSLLTFLVAKLIVAASTPTRAPTPNTPRSSQGNLATWLATADNGSPHGALVLLLFSITWILHLARILFMLCLLVVFGGLFLFASTLDADDKEDTAAGGKGFFHDDESRQNFTTALVEFEEKIGFTFGDSLEDSPWLIFQVVSVTWAMFSLLMMQERPVGDSPFQQKRLHSRVHLPMTVSAVVLSIFKSKRVRGAVV